MKNFLFFSLLLALTVSCSKESETNPATPVTPATPEKTNDNNTSIDPLVSYVINNVEAQIGSNNLTFLKISNTEYGEPMNPETPIYCGDIIYITFMSSDLNMFGHIELPDFSSGIFGNDMEQSDPFLINCDQATLSALESYNQYGGERPSITTISQDSNSQIYPSKVTFFLSF